jgi:hypothetical protein
MPTDDKNALGTLILIVNVLVLGLNIKLYTEYFKDRKQDERARTSR